MKRGPTIAAKAALSAAAFALAPAAIATTFTVTVGPGGLAVFSPASQTIAVGDTVHWVWASSGHSTTSGSVLCLADDRWNSGLQATPFDFSVTFTAPGTFSYFCLAHCAIGMTGEIVVQQPIPTATPTPTGLSQTGTATPLPQTATPGTPSPGVPGAVPTLSPALLGFFGLALAAAALLALKRE